MSRPNESFFNPTLHEFLLIEGKAFADVTVEFYYFCSGTCCCERYDLDFSNVF